MRNEENFRTLVVGGEAVGTTDAKLTTRVGLIVGRVVHGGNIDDLDFVDGLRGADSTLASGIVRPSLGTGSAVFCHAISVSS